MDNRKQFDEILAQGVNDENDIYFQQELKMFGRHLFINRDHPDSSQYDKYIHSSKEMQYFMRKEALERIEKKKRLVRDMSRQLDYLQGKQISDKRIEKLEKSDLIIVNYSVEKNNKITLWLEKKIDKRISFSHNRAKYLQKIISDTEIGKRTPAQSLNKNAELSNISRAITEINRRIQKKMSLIDFIEKNSDGNGYGIKKNCAVKLIE